MHLPSSAIGKDLFDEAVASTGIEKDKDYFGLSFIDTDNQEDWLDMDKRILEQKINTNSLRFQLKIRFYPGQERDLVEMEEVAMRLLFKQVCIRSCKNLLRQNISRHLLQIGILTKALLKYFQVQSDILSKKIHCPEETAVMMSSHEGGSKEDMLLYLKLAQGLNMYGVTYFPVRDLGIPIVKYINIPLLKDPGVSVWPTTKILCIHSEGINFQTPGKGFNGLLDFDMYSGFV